MVQVQSIDEHTKAKDKNERLLATLLGQIEADKLVSHQWNSLSLVLIYITLVIIIILEIQQVSIAIVTSLAVISLVIFVLVNRIHRKRLEKQIRNNRIDNYRMILDNIAQYPDDPPEKRDNPLSTRELQILGFISKGYINKQIAAELKLSPATIRNQVSHLMESLGVDDRTAAVVTAIKNGWLKI